MNELDRGMDRALRQAQFAFDVDEVPVGAVVMRGERILGVGHNHIVTGCDPTAHAEMIVIREACQKLGRWRLTGATLYVTIEPCPMCAGALVMSRIDRLVYGSADYKAGAVESLFNVTQNSALNHSMMVTSGVKTDECSGIMKEFFRERRKQKKILTIIDK